MEDRKKKIIIMAGTVSLVSIAGAVLAACLLLHKNPVEKGLANLVEEVAAQEEKQGESLFTHTINQIGHGNIQLEYSLNVSGSPLLQNMTVGLDGSVKRDMEKRLLGIDIKASIANVNLVDIHGYGKGDLQENSLDSTCYLEVPSLWDGNVVFQAKDVDGQWNHSEAKRQLELATGQGLALPDGIDIDLFQEFSIEPFSSADFLAEHGDALKTLYKEMEVLELGKALKKGMLEEGQAEELQSYMMKDEAGEVVESDSYLLVLPKEPLCQIVQGITEDIRLCVYLDSEERIVRIAQIPGEMMVTEVGTAISSLNLLGEEATIDRLEIEFSHTGKLEKLFPDAPAGTVKADGVILVEDGQRLSVDIDNMTWREQDDVLFRLNGKAVFEPLAGEITAPSGAEYHIAEMNRIETLMFLMECGKNFYKNYSGYLKMFE